MDAEHQREAAWHDRQAALLLLHDLGVEMGEAELSAQGAKLALERREGHAAWEAGRIFRRRVVAELIGTQDLLDNGVAADVLLPSLLKELNALAGKFRDQL